MPSKKKYRIWCNTEEANVFGFSNLDDPPTSCPNNPAHSVNSNTKCVTEVYCIDNLTATTNPGVGDDIDDGYGVGSRWINVYSKDVFECVDNCSGAAVWSIPVVNWQSSESDVESTTTATSWQDKVILTTPALNGTFLMIYSAEIKTGNTESKAKIRCRNTTDNVTLANSNSISTDYEGFGSSSVVFFTGTAKTLKLQWQAQTEGNTAYIQNARMRFWRVA